jgi:hypothetical protein
VKRLDLVKRLRNDGVLQEDFEGDDFERGLVRGLEDDGAGRAVALHLEPTGGADAPAVAGLQAGKAVLRHGGGEIVAEALGGSEELGGDDAADGVDAEVVGAGGAATVAVEAGEGVHAAGLKGLAEDVLLRGELGIGGHGVIVVEGRTARAECD